MINLDDRILAEVDECQLFLLCAIAKHIGADMKAWPSNRKLCEITKWSINKLQKVKQSLIKSGLISVECRYHNNSQSSNFYRVRSKYISVLVDLEQMQAVPQDETLPLPKKRVPPLPNNVVPTLPQSVVPPLPQNRVTEVLTIEVLTIEERERTHPKNDIQSFKEDAFENGKVAPAAENSAAAPTHYVTTTDPSDPRVKVVTPFTMPKVVETIDEAEAKIMEWAQGEGRESVKYWYELAGRKCTLGDVTAMVSKFAGVYLTIGDESKRQRMAQDPLQFFKYTFKGFLKNEKSFAANTTATNANGYNSNNTQSVLPKALQNQVGK